MTASPSLPDRPDHVGELRLRRHRLGELPPAESGGVEKHLQDCATCRGKLRVLEEEDSTFRAEISFDQFAAGVSRAHRVPRPTRRRMLGVVSVLAVAAAAVFLVRGQEKRTTNAIKGDAITGQLRIAGVLGQRPLDPNTADSLQPGERVRIGYRSPEPAFLIAVSIDDQGQITPLYPESGLAMPVEPSSELRFLPDSLEFTGAGKERLFLFLSPSAVNVESLTRPARAVFEQDHRDLERMRDLPFPVPGSHSFTWLLTKP
jgi:hypothetical protein